MEYLSNIFFAIILIAGIGFFCDECSKAYKKH